MNEGVRSMKARKLNKGQKLDVQLQNRTWSWEKWEDFCRKNDCGLIVEDGNVKGFVTEPVEYRV